MAPTSRFFLHRVAVTSAAVLLLALTPFDASAQRPRTGNEPQPAQGIATRDYVEAIAPMVFCVAWPDAQYERLQWQGMQPGQSGSNAAAATSGRRGSGSAALPSIVDVSAVLWGRGRSDGAQRSVAVSMSIDGEVLRSIEWGEHGEEGPEPGGGADLPGAVAEINAAYTTHRPNGGNLPPPFSSRCGGGADESTTLTLTSGGYLP